MATIDLWIQLENHPWDIAPRTGINRIDGTPVSATPPVSKTLRSPVSGVTRTVAMRRPLAQDALIFRRYTENWAAPADRKVNPWDLNEPDPTDQGTMGTIPGPVIECNVGDTVRVHFRNLDQRTKPAPPLVKASSIGFGAFNLVDLAGIDLGAFFPRRVPLPAAKRAHSMHTHGFVFAPTSDGAYPLSPPDTSQPIAPGDPEAPAWAELGVTGFKQGDRVPSGGTFTYTWQTLGWPTTAGVWLYHDHSICDMENVNLGAIGMVVIHNPADTENEVEITPARLPGESFNGSPVTARLLPVSAADLDIAVLPHDLLKLGVLADEVEPAPGGFGAGGMGMAMAGGETMGAMSVAASLPPPAGFEELMIRALAGEHDADDTKRRVKGRVRKSTKDHEAIALERTIRRGDMLMELNDKFTQVSRLFLRRFRTPPDQGLYLQLFHEFGGMGMCINGRQAMGNTPTMVAGPNTRMRFGVVGMGDVPHTFHIHGHRWILPGPAGNTLNTIMNSAQNSPVSQFEDTRLLGPANSFAFTIEEGQGFMRASPPLGEWHMHCHVLGHMMSGMMGSLLIVNGGELAGTLAVGKPCPADDAPATPPTGGKTVQVDIRYPGFSPNPVNVSMGDTVVWTNRDGFAHTVTADGGSFSSPSMAGSATFSHTFSAMGSFAYHCNIHPEMTGTVVVS